MDKFWEILANGAVGLVSGCVGACVGAYYTLWLQAKDKRIRVINEGSLYVEYSAIKRDEEGYYIPGYGRVISHGYWKTDEKPEPDDPRLLENHPEVKKRRGKVAFICVDRTAAASEVKQYVISRVVPI